MSKEWKEQSGADWNPKYITKKFMKLTTPKRSSYEKQEYETFAISDLERLSAYSGNGEKSKRKGRSVVVGPNRPLQIKESMSQAPRVPDIIVSQFSPKV